MRHPQEDPCNVLHSWPSFLQTWIEFHSSSCLPIFTPGSEGLWSDQLGNSRIWGATHLSKSLHKITITPKLAIKTYSNPIDLSWNLESQTWTTAEVSHTFTPFVNNTSGQCILIRFRFLPLLCNLYTSKNSSAWWKVNRLVAMPSKLKPSSWSTLITFFVPAHKIISTWDRYCKN